MDRYIAIGGGLAVVDEDKRRAEDGSGLQLLFGWQITPHFNLELSSSYYNFETGNDTMSDFYRSALGLDVMWVSHMRGWTPFLIAGIGAAHNDVFPDADDGVGATANAGIGIMSAPLGAYGLRLRAEARAVYDQNLGGPTDVHANVGIVVPLRRIPEPVVRTEVRIVEVVREDIPPPPPAPRIAPPDTDRDGVDDTRDRCANTLYGTQVDREGCAVAQAVVILQGVHFETGSARLTHDSLAILIQAAAALHGQPSMRIEVRGHTDSVGKDEYNENLSRQRAESVVAFLVESGVPANRLTAFGFGESRPVADNATPEGRASNRRVEFRVLTR